MDKLSIPLSSPLTVIEALPPEASITHLNRAFSAPASSNAGSKHSSPKTSPAASMSKSLTLTKVTDTIPRAPTTKLIDISCRIEALLFNSDTGKLNYLHIDAERTKTELNVTVRPYSADEFISHFSVVKGFTGSKVRFYLWGTNLPIAESQVNQTSGAMGYCLQLTSDFKLYSLDTRTLKSQYDPVTEIL